MALKIRFISKESHGAYLQILLLDEDFEFVVRYIFGNLCVRLTYLNSWVP